MLKTVGGWALIVLAIALFIPMIIATGYEIADLDLYGFGVGFMVSFFAVQLFEIGYLNVTGREFPIALSRHRQALGYNFPYEKIRRMPVGF